MYCARSTVFNGHVREQGFGVDASKFRVTREGGRGAAGGQTGAAGSWEGSEGVEVMDMKLQYEQGTEEKKVSVFTV
jgi:hypothetical protein